MYKVIMIFENGEYQYGAYESKDKANEIALLIKEQRQIETYVEKE